VFACDVSHICETINGSFTLGFFSISIAHGFFPLNKDQFTTNAIIIIDQAHTAASPVGGPLDVGCRAIIRQTMDLYHSGLRVFSFTNNKSCDDR
jgi:hypothetical protein